jgi:sRNA-binding protein
MMGHQEILDMLCDRYPKCFYHDPKKGRPISKRIVEDLIKDGVGVPESLLEDVVNLYKAGVEYQELVVVNADRIDLNGSVVSYVSVSEASRARKYLRRTRNIGRHRNPVDVMQSLHEAGFVTDDALSQIDAPKRR